MDADGGVVRAVRPATLTDPGANEALRELPVVVVSTSCAREEDVSPPPLLATAPCSPLSFSSAEFSFAALWHWLRSARAACAARWAGCPPWPYTEGAHTKALRHEGGRLAPPLLPRSRCGKNAEGLKTAGRRADSKMSLTPAGGRVDLVWLRQALHRNDWR